MARSIAARRKGDDYQSRVFWYHLLQLRAGNCESVTLEHDGVSFVDDVVVSYDLPVKDRPTGWDVHCDLHQCKFHVTADGAFTWENLLDPDFIHSERSMLARLLEAYQQMRAQSPQRRFLLSVVSNWKWHPEDGLAPHLAEPAIRGTLFEGGARSQAGRIRRAFAEHLNTPETQLRDFLDTVRFRLGRSLDDWHSDLQPWLKLAGMAACDSGCSSCRYDDLTWKLFDQGRNSFDRKSFDELVHSERLLAPKAEPGSEISICSRPEFARRPKDLQALQLDLCDLFDGRFALSQGAWTTEIPRRAFDFVQSSAFRGLPQPVQVFFDCHLSIAYLMGHLLNPKYGIQAIPAQKTRQTGYEYWIEPADQTSETLWTVTHTGQGGSGSEAIVAISVTNPVEQHLERFLASAGLGSGTVIHFKPVQGTGSRAVPDGAAAWSMAQEVQRVLRDTLPATCKTVHLFFSGPAALAYILGNTLRYVAPSVQLYEHDFEGGSVEERYFPTICITNRR